ncbi:unnamed protein product, partial [Pylaiella littoralis]
MKMPTMFGTIVAMMLLPGWVAATPISLTFEPVGSKVGTFLSRLLTPSSATPIGRRLACVGEIVLLDGVGARAFDESLATFRYPLPEICHEDNKRSSSSSRMAPWAESATAAAEEEGLQRPVEGQEKTSRALTVKTFWGWPDQTNTGGRQADDERGRNAKALTVWKGSLSAAPTAIFADAQVATYTTVFILRRGDGDGDRDRSSVCLRTLLLGVVCLERMPQHWLAGFLAGSTVMEPAATTAMVPFVPHVLPASPTTRVAQWLTLTALTVHVLWVAIVRRKARAARHHVRAIAPAPVDPAPEHLVNFRLVRAIAPARDQWALRHPVHVPEVRAIVPARNYWAPRHPVHVLHEQAIVLARGFSEPRQPIDAGQILSLRVSRCAVLPSGELGVANTPPSPGTSIPPGIEADTPPGPGARVAFYFLTGCSCVEEVMDVVAHNLRPVFEHFRGWVIGVCAILEGPPSSLTVVFIDVETLYEDMGWGMGTQHDAHSTAGGAPAVSTPPAADGSAPSMGDMHAEAGLLLSRFGVQQGSDTVPGAQLHPAG